MHQAVINAKHPARKQNVSVGTTVNGYKLDLVPARRQSSHGNMHSLYKSKSDSWTKTDISKHISYVKNSGRIEEIKLAKIWCRLHNLEFPSFYLEMAVIDALKNASIGDIENNFAKLLIFFRDDLSNKRYVDPSNTNNIISDDLDKLQLAFISAQAKVSVAKRYWKDIVW